MLLYLIQWVLYHFSPFYLLLVCCYICLQKEPLVKLLIFLFPSQSPNSSCCQPSSFDQFLKWWLCGCWHVHNHYRSSGINKHQIYHVLYISQVSIFKMLSAQTFTTFPYKHDCNCTKWFSEIKFPIYTDYKEKTKIIKNYRFSSFLGNWMIKFKFFVMSFVL